MRILLTNDDGIHAPGLWALHAALAPGNEVTIVAPDRERTGVGHAITLHHPLRTARLAVNGTEGYAVNGTPADCVKLAILEILGGRPDLVVSGLNPGANVGVNLHYSGTVAAAREAALGGVPAIAASIDGRAPRDVAAPARFVRRLADRIAAHGLRPGTFLNVNFPDVGWEATAGVRVSRQGLSVFREYVEKRLDPRNRPYYWQGADVQRFDEDPPDVDGSALRSGFVSVTPIRCDMTDYDGLDRLKGWELDLNGGEGGA